MIGFIATSISNLFDLAGSVVASIILILSLSAWLVELARIKPKATAQITTTLQFAHQNWHAYEVPNAQLTNDVKDAMGLCTMEHVTLLSKSAADGTALLHSHWTTALLPVIWKVPTRKSCLEVTWGLAKQLPQLKSDLLSKPAVKEALDPIRKCDPSAVDGYN